MPVIPELLMSCARPLTVGLVTVTLAPLITSLSPTDKLPGLEICPTMVGTLNVQSSLPTNTQLLLVFLKYTGLYELLGTTAYSPTAPTDDLGTLPFKSAESVMILGFFNPN